MNGGWLVCEMEERTRRDVFRGNRREVVKKAKGERRGMERAGGGPGRL